MDRRDFLKATGAASLGAVAFPAATQFQAPPAEAADTGDWGFNFTAHSIAGPVDGVLHRVKLSGAGAFTMSRVSGGGVFNHWDDAAAVPRPLIGSGTWIARRVVSWRTIGTSGGLAAGVLELDIELARDWPSSAVLPASLRIASNITAAGLTTGEPDSLILSIPGTPFALGGAVGPFGPLTPIAGNTIFTSGAEFGASDPAWRQEFEKVHGRLPTLEDRVDRIWSQEFQASNGRPPNDADWTTRWKTTGP